MTKKTALELAREQFDHMFGPYQQMSHGYREGSVKVEHSSTKPPEPVTLKHQHLYQVDVSKNGYRRVATVYSSRSYDEFCEFHRKQYDDHCYFWADGFMANDPDFISITEVEAKE